jgi:hypothetical protein
MDSHIKTGRKVRLYVENGLSDVLWIAVVNLLLEKLKS